MTITKDIFEVQDFIPKEKQQWLINYMLKPNFPYAFTHDAVKGVKENEDIILEDDAIVGMFHTLLIDGTPCSPHFDDIKWILDYFEPLGLKDKPINRIRIGLFFKNPFTESHEPHVDLRSDHTTAVYYVNDCDGDFYFYEESNITHPFKKPTEYTLKKKVSPAQGKLVVFNGNHYHASSYPNQKPVRLAITFNFLP